METDKQINQPKKRYRVSQILGVIVGVIFCVVWLGGCVLFGTSMCSVYEETNPISNEYVGVWAAYKVKANDQEFYYESIDEVYDFLVLKNDGNAQEIIAPEHEKPRIFECSWLRTTNDKQSGTKAGVLLMGKDEPIGGPYRYFPSEKSYLVDTPLMEGFLYIEYENRTVYMEKISNNPDDKPWLNKKGATTNTNNESGKSSEAKSSSGKEIPGNARPWDEASKYIGETVTLYGPVVDTEYASASSGRPTFVDIGIGYPDKNRLTITIWGKNRNNFSSAPETFYQDKIICVKGKVYLHEGVCNVEVTSPEQISVL